MLIIPKKKKSDVTKYLYSKISLTGISILAELLPGTIKTFNEMISLKDDHSTKWSKHINIVTTPLVVQRQ